MTSIQAIKKSILTVSATLLVAVVTAFGLFSDSSFAANVLPQTFNQSLPLAALERVNAVGKNIEGKAQEAIGNLTGDPKDQAVGKAKQAQGQARGTAASVKDSANNTLGRTKAVAKNLEGKTQEAFGKTTGDSKNQAAGKAKQGESQARNAIEDVKEKIQDIFN